MIKNLFNKAGKAPLEKVRQSITANPQWSKPVQQYLATPLPWANGTLADLNFVAIDFETTGLNCQQDKILSIGAVNLTIDMIELASSEEIYIRHGEFIKAESAQINEITPKQLHEGVDIDTAIDWLLEKIQGKVVLAHCANIEKLFIESYLKDRYQLNTFPCYFIDTLQLEKYRSYAGKSNQHTSYQLDDLRQYHNLPAYYSHSAASDAVACAELFLVQVKKLNLASDFSLNELSAN
ncbi:exonuclease domain-containing protein [Photobacterium profundum]|uniref:3'-5' exonuclease n=1 Tax=Photobacterium profundum TaxID=74109 RepID=UPI003D0C399B